MSKPGKKGPTAKLSTNKPSLDAKKEEAKRLAEAQLAKIEKVLQADIQKRIQRINPIRLAVFQAKYRAKLKPGRWEDSLNDAFCKEVLGLDPKKHGRKKITHYIGVLQRNFKTDLKTFGDDGKFGVESLQGFFKHYLKSKVFKCQQGLS